MVLSKLPSARFRSGPRNDEFFRRGVSTVVCRCLLQIRVPKGKASDTQIEPKRQPPKSKWSQKGSKTSQGTFKNSPCGTSSEKWWKSGSASLAFGSRFCIEIHINLKKYNTRKYYNVGEHDKWCQSDAKRDTEIMDFPIFLRRVTLGSCRFYASKNWHMKIEDPEIHENDKSIFEKIIKQI